MTNTPGCRSGLVRRTPARAGRSSAWGAGRAWPAIAALFALLLCGARASAAPEAHILRIDPRASTVDGSPVLTTVIEVVQNKRLGDLTKPCNAQTGDANLDCVANA